MEEDVGVIREIFYLMRKHKKSGMEFTREGKVVIMDDELGISQVSAEKVRNYVRLGRKVIENTNNLIKQRFKRV